MAARKLYIAEVGFFVLAYSWQLLGSVAHAHTSMELQHERGATFADLRSHFYFLFPISFPGFGSLSHRTDVRQSALSLAWDRAGSEGWHGWSVVSSEFLALASSHSSHLTLHSSLWLGSVAPLILRALRGDQPQLPPPLLRHIHHPRKPLRWRLHTYQIFPLLSRILCGHILA